MSNDTKTIKLNTSIENIGNAWCDSGHDTCENVMKIQIGEHDFQLCSNHLLRILKKELGDIDGNVSELRKLPVIEYAIAHNDRGEFRSESLIVAGVQEFRDEHDQPGFNIVDRPTLKKVIDIIGNNEFICITKTDVMTGKYDDATTVSKHRVKADIVLKYLERKTDTPDYYTFSDYISEFVLNW